ncbi:MAG: dioxygenase [Pseudomonadota bacterium]
MAPTAKHRLSETDLTTQTLARLDKPDDPRLAEIFEALVRHSHAFVREVGLTHQEWQTGVAFLRAIADFSDDKRNEMILMSDHLGISAMVDLISDRGKTSETSATGLGPFYIPGQPILANDSSILTSDVPGKPMWFRGRVEDTAGQPVENCLIEVWQAHEEGLYDLQEGEAINMRGTFKTDAQGYFGFTAVYPKGYPLPPDGPVKPVMEKVKSAYMRPAHLHTLVRAAEDAPPLVTHLFMPEDPYLDNDPVMGVRSDLMVDVEELPADAEGLPETLAGKASVMLVRYTFVI